MSKTPRTDAARVFAYGHVDKYWIEVAFARQLETELADALADNAALREVLARAKVEAETLATSIHKAEYAGEAPDWGLCDTVAGVITQIDNMYCGVRQQRDEARFDNAALRDALVVRVAFGTSFEDAEPCPDCSIFRGLHDETCRHYATERKAMETTGGKWDMRKTPRTDDLQWFVNDRSIRLAKTMLDESAPHEVLHMIAAFIGLSEDTIDYANDSAADGFTLESESARDRATNYERSANALCKIWGVANSLSSRNDPPNAETTGGK